MHQLVHNFHIFIIPMVSPEAVYQNQEKSSYYEYKPDLKKDGEEIEILTSKHVRMDFGVLNKGEEPTDLKCFQTNGALILLQLMQRHTFAAMLDLKDGESNRIVYPFGYEAKAESARVLEGDVPAGDMSTADNKDESTADNKDVSTADNKDVSTADNKDTKETTKGETDTTTDQPKDVKSGTVESAQSPKTPNADDNSDNNDNSSTDEKKTELNPQDPESVNPDDSQAPLEPLPGSNPDSKDGTGKNETNTNSNTQNNSEVHDNQDPQNVENEKNSNTSSKGGTSNNKAVHLSDWGLTPIKWDDYDRNWENINQIIGKNYFKAYFDQKVTNDDIFFKSFGDHLVKAADENSKVSELKGFVHGISKEYDSKYRQGKLFFNQLIGRLCTGEREIF